MSGGLALLSNHHARRYEMPEKQVTFDKEFVQALERDPEKVLKDLGLEPTPEVVAAIREINSESLYSLAQAFSKVSREEVAMIFP
jgi:hypothetical protein